MSFLSDVCDGVGNFAKSVAHTAEDVVDVAENVAEDVVDNTVNGLKDTFDSPGSVLKAVAFATILSPVSIALTAYELGDDIYTETDKKLKEKNG
jgi:hypothetical protein